MSSKEYLRNYYLTHREQFRKYHRKSYSKNRKRVIARASKYRKENPERAKEWRIKQNRSFHGHLVRMWCAVARRIKVQPSYKGRTLDFDKEWFMRFGSESLDYQKLHARWVKSKFERKLIPTLDRINNNLGYLKTNIQFLTSSANSRKPRYKYGTRNKL